MQKDTGFTLLELIITVAVLAILVTLGIPSFQATIRNNRLTTSTNELIVALNLARSEAIKRGETVTICKSDNQANCTPDSGNWEDGWIVFIDDAAPVDAGDGPIDAGDTVIQIKESMAGGITLRTGVNFDDYMQYQSTGLSLGDGGGIGNDSFTFCDARGASHAKRVIVSATGRPRVNVGAASCP